VRVGPPRVRARRPTDAMLFRRPWREAWRAALKRTFDVVVAALVLAALMPLLLLIALLVVVDSPGPVFYRSTRAGFRGRPLRMLKFRKMRADARGAHLTLADDARLTRLGAWLVRTKLDELPQLWHVLRGEMSLVGPRPESPSCVDRYRTDYGLILSVRPGLTGYTQLAFAREGSILDPNDPEGHYLRGLLPQKVALDRLYAARPSLRRDVWILGATILTVVCRQPLAVDRTTGAVTLRRRRTAVEPTRPVRAVTPVPDLPVAAQAMPDLPVVAQAMPDRPVVAEADHSSERWA
jgi:lipopolysaccharide/colanic/teichoic acid biosynthesis glycosyltransferase